MENCILYDYVSITTRIHQVADIIELIGLKQVPWITTHGTKGFQFRQYYDCISIHHTREDDIVWLEMTGQGCRVFETIGTGDYESLFNLVKDNPKQVNLTRLDIAFDDHTGILDMNTLLQDTVSQLYISKFKKWKVEYGSDGTTINHGSKQSEIFIRIYDKAMERGLKDGSHWIRTEIQLRDERAEQFINNNDDLGNKFNSVLLNYLRYVNRGCESNKWIWQLKEYWQNLVNEALPMKLNVMPGTDYNLSKLDNLVFHQLANPIKTAIEIYGIDGFIEQVNEATTRPNPKYEILKDEIKRKFEGS